jgi:hypothetical protein
MSTCRARFQSLKRDQWVAKLSTSRERCCALEACVCSIFVRYIVATECQTVGLDTSRYRDIGYVIYIWGDEARRANERCVLSACVYQEVHCHHR